MILMETGMYANVDQKLCKQDEEAGLYILLSGSEMNGGDKIYKTLASIAKSL